MHHSPVLGPLMCKLPSPGGSQDFDVVSQPQQLSATSAGNSLFAEWMDESVTVIADPDSNHIRVSPGN